MEASHESRPAHAEAEGSRWYVLGVIAGAVLVGVGLTGMAYWIYSGFHWLYLGSVAPLLAGGLILFSRLSGPDHA